MSGGMATRDRQSSLGSPRLEVGEVDTRAPFRSVKAAVSLFGEGTTQKEKRLNKISGPSSERVLDKETQLHLAVRQLNKLKEQLKNAENTKGRAHFDLEKAKRTLQDLNCKLNTVIQSKKSAIEATEAAKNRAKQLEEVCSKERIRSPDAWRQQLEQEREQYRTASNELAIVKQKLRKIQQDFDSFLEAKIVGFQQAADAQHAVKTNREKVTELSKDTAAMRNSLSQVKLAAIQAKEEQTQIMTEREAHHKSHRTAMEEAERKMLSLNREFDPQLRRDLERKLAEATTEIEMLQEEIKTARASWMDSVRLLNFELDDAKKKLQNVAEEESLLRSSVDSLKLELEDVKEEHSKLKVKEGETESLIRNLSKEVEKRNSELETTIAKGAEVGEASNETIITFQQLSAESKHAQREVEEIKMNIEELKLEADISRIASSEAEKKLEFAVEEAKEAKAAEKTALDQMKMKMNILNASTDDATALNSDDDGAAKIKLSTEEFEALTRKVEECESVTEEKGATTTAEMEAIKLSEDGLLSKLETSLREIEVIEAATDEALKKAEMAEAAKKVVETELKRWRRREEEEEEEMKASEILQVQEMSS